MSKVIKYLNETNVTKFYSMIPEDNLRDQLIFKLMGKMGLRVGEVAGETLDYWTFEGKVITVDEIPQDKVEGNGFVHVVTVLPGVHLEHIDWFERVLVVHGKGSAERRVPISKDVWALLGKFISVDTLTREELLQLKGRLITKYDDLPLSTQQVRKICRKYSSKAGLQTLGIHPHMFRHTFAVNYLLKGGGIRQLQIILGHSSLAITEKYLQLIEKDIRKDFDKVEMTDDLMKDPAKFKRELAESMVRSVMDKMG